jgi:tagatose 1,6-diphosphate aldolase GatY/KbaY
LNDHLRAKIFLLKDLSNRILPANFSLLENYMNSFFTILKLNKEYSGPLLWQVGQFSSTLESSICYMGRTIAATMGKCALCEFGLEGWLHLDHGSSVQMVQDCLYERFDSVMIDASEKLIEENITIIRQVIWYM